MIEANEPNETSEEKTKRLKLLAMDCAAGLVFTDRHCQSPDDISMVFMPLMFLGREQAATMAQKIGNRGVIYEYLSEAGPRSVNGLPSFFSMKIVPDIEANEFHRYWQEERERRKAVA